MAASSWTSTVRRVAGHPLVRMTTAAALQALVSHLAQQDGPRPSCANACARVPADRFEVPAARTRTH